MTWEQLLPGLPPNGRAVYVMLGTVERTADVPGERAVAGKALASSTAQSQSVARRNIWKFAERVPKWACSPFLGPVTCSKPTGNQFSVVSREY